MDVGGQIKDGQGLTVLCGGLITPEYFRYSHFGCKEQKPKREGNELAPQR